MSQTKYIFLMWQLLAAMDSGVEIDIADVKRHAKAETTSRLLLDRLGAEADFSIFYPNDWKTINDRFASISNVVDEGRKFGVTKDGMCLLMAYALQCAQELKE